MIHPHSEVRYINPAVGYGLVAKTFIPKGTITWVKDGLDREFNQQQLAQVDVLTRETLENYSYRNRHGAYVFCWDHARYINHSFVPNCFPTAYGFEIAVRDIQVGEELTNDYGCLNIIEPFEPQDEGCARKIVYPDDLLNFSAAWDQLLRDIIPLAVAVSQPLRQYLDDPTWAELTSIHAGHARVKSISECYFSG